MIKRNVSIFVEVGGFAASVESELAKIYVGICVDTACTLGVCAERNAIFNMLYSLNYLKHILIPTFEKISTIKNLEEMQDLH